MKRHRLFLLAVSCLCGFFSIGLSAAADSESSYSYWSQFKPGTFVSFRQSMKTGDVIQVMLKTFTLKEVSPESVVLEYKESPPTDAGRMAPAQAPIFLSTRIEFHEADELNNNPDLFGSHLDVNILRLLKSTDGTKLDEGFEDLIIKGKNISAAKTKINYGEKNTQTTITTWLSEEVPGRVAKFIREINADRTYREDVVVADFLAIKADPADREKLRISRKPAIIEVSGISYVEYHFRFFDDLDEIVQDLKNVRVAVQALVPGNPNTNWSDVYRIISPFLEKVQNSKKHLAEDKQKARMEIGADEIEKLRPFLEQADRTIDLLLEQNKFIGFLSALATDPPEYHVIVSALEEFKSSQTEFAVTQIKMQEELKKLGKIKIKYMR